MSAQEDVKKLLRAAALLQRDEDIPHYEVVARGQLMSNVITKHVGLFAAAPEMYEAIKAALKEPNDRAWDMLRNAVKKAEGK